MYEERRDSFSLKDIILQVICIISFVCLLLLLFPTSRYIKKTLKHKNEEQTVRVNASDDAIANLDKDEQFKNNLLVMKEAAKSYYNQDKLPKEKDKKSKLTLNQMYEKNLLDTLFDENGKMCDGKKSNVLVVNNGNEYQYNINLSCNNNEDSITFYMGNYNYCDDNSLCELQKDKKKEQKQEKDNSACKLKINNPKITIYFITNGGSPVERLSFVKDSNEVKITIPNSEKENYKFAGWYGDVNTATKINITSTASEDIKYLALYEDFPTIADKGCTISKNYVAFLYAKWDKKEAKKEKKIDNNNNDNKEKKETKENNNNNNNSNKQTNKNLCLYKKVTKARYGPYGNWSSWSTKKVSGSAYYQVDTKVEHGKKYYRYRSRVYYSGAVHKYWSSCNPVDQSLINNGYFLVENK